MEWARGAIGVGVLALWWGTLALYTTHRVPYTLMLVIAGSVVLLSALATALVALRHPRTFALLVMASPIVLVPAWVAGGTTLDYARGRATFMASGLPASIPPFGIEPGLRVPMRYTGCLTDDLLELRNAINNATVETLVAWFGPMPGTYTDPLPTEDEIVRALARRGRPVSTVVPDGTWPVSVEYYLLQQRDLTEELRIAPLDDARLLAVGWRYDERDDQRTVVIDLETGRHLGGWPL